MIELWFHFPFSIIFESLPCGLLQKLAWKGLSDHRGGDGLAFIRGFNLELQDYEDLARLHDLFKDAQSAACVWLKSNPNKWEKLIKFPERKSEPLLCFLWGESRNSGLCNREYIVGWVLLLLQALGCMGIILWSRNLKQPKSFAEAGRSVIEDAMAGFEHLVFLSYFLTALWL